MQLHTRRLILREYRASDFEAMREIDSDPEVQRYRGAVTITAQQTRAYLAATKGWAQEQPRTRYPFAVTLRSDDRVLGWAPLRIVNHELREAEIGWTITRRLWGQGYATEAAHALLTLGFGELTLHRIWAVCRTENIASWRVMEKLGMRREAHFREIEWTAGAWRDQFLYAILDHDWRSTQARPLA